MPDYQKILEERQKRDWERQKRSEERMKEKMEAGQGMKRQEEFQRKSRSDKDYFSSKQEGNFSRLGTSISEPETLPSVGEQIEAGRDLYQKRLAEQRAAAREAVMPGAPAMPEEMPKDERGIKGSWARLRARLGALRAQKEALAAELGVGITATQAAQQVIQQSVRRVWYAIHEFFEELAFGTFFLTSPLCVAVLIIRIVGMLCFNFFLTIKIKGVEVKPFPSFGVGDISRVKTGIAIIMTFVMFIIIYIATHPCTTVGSIFGENVADIFGDICGEG